MKVKLISNAGVSVVILLINFLFFAPIVSAQNPIQPSPIDGLRFDTPIPTQYNQKNYTLYFLASYDLKATELLTVKNQTPEQPTSVIDILIPQVLVEESTQSSILTTTIEATSEAQLENEEEITLALNEQETTPHPTPTTTKKPQPTNKPTIKPTSKPTTPPSPTPLISPSPSPTTESAPANSLSADKIFQLVNNYRNSKGLPPVEKDERACEIARSRAPEIAAEISGGYMHRGIRARNLPYFNSEIIISMRTEEAAVDWWINDKIHRDQMEGNYKYSCAACYGNSCVQEFTNFTPKG